MDGYSLAELLYAGICKCFYWPRHTRIIHNNIDPSKLLSDTFKHGIDSRLICNIYSWENTYLAIRTRRRNYLLQNTCSLIERLLPPAHDDNIGAVFSKLSSDCLSNTSSATRDNYRLIRIY